MALELSQMAFTVISYFVVLWIIGIALYIVAVAIRRSEEILGQA